VCAVIHVLAVVVGDVSCCIVVVCVIIELYNYEYEHEYIYYIYYEKVRVWSTRTGATLANWNSSKRGHGAAVTQLLTDKNFAYTGAKDGSVRVWPLTLTQSEVSGAAGDEVA
jgi:WD40 repeat protein